MKLPLAPVAQLVKRIWIILHSAASIVVLLQLFSNTWVAVVGALELVHVGEGEVAEPDIVNGPVART